jgi:large subunit ribosomal protein L6
MSRIGNKPIPLGTASIAIDGNTVKVKGKKGELSQVLPPLVTIAQEGTDIVVKRDNEGRRARAMHGLARSLVNNMIVGVTTGFTRELLIQGVGYRAASAGSTLTLNLGYSHPVEYAIPTGISVKVEKNTQVLVEGIDKQQVGQVAAIIREFRPPEPYKGKGVRYKEEVVRRKEGKTV